MKLITVIPARMASTRFPGKPLVDILGMPMVEHVRRRAMLHPLVNEAIVATCDKEIFDVVTSNDGKAIMTSEKHYCCTDRVAEAAEHFDADVVINIQGDEPLFDPEMLTYLLNPIQQDPEVRCSNLMAEIKTDKEFNDINEVKVVCDLNWNAMYLSREPIPSGRKTNSYDYYKYRQLGVYAFKKESLALFGQWGPSPWESIETVDMVRFLEHGCPVRMVVSPFPSIGVDTPEDLKIAIALMKKDHLFGSY
jgi:3-deoxy-manno-octulosonate cytidylyltransferase (CMP-KDO synthetase)